MYYQHIILDFEMNPVAKGNRNIKKELTREIIEIGAVKLNSNLEIIGRFNCLVKPQYSNDISSYITKLTGITSADVHKAVTFCEAVKMFEKWIGNEKTRIYSWSDSDLKQLQSECIFKEVPMPENMRRWMDFQLVYPRLMKIGGLGKKMSLKEAVTWYGISIVDKKAHRALYDAEVTTELVSSVLSGEYKKQMEVLNRNITREENRETSVCLGEIYSGVFAQILQNMKQELEYAR